MLSRQLIHRTASRSAATTLTSRYGKPFPTQNLNIIQARAITWKKKKGDSQLMPNSKMTPTETAPAEPPMPTPTTEQIYEVRMGARGLVSAVRTQIDGTGLRDIAQPIPVAASVSASAYPVSEAVLRLLVHMSELTIDNTGMGCAAPQLGTCYVRVHHPLHV